MKLLTLSILLLLPVIMIPTVQSQNLDQSHIVSIFNPSYWNGTDLEFVNTSINPSSDPNYDYEVLTGIYHAFFKNDPTTSELVRYIYNESFIRGNNPHKQGFATFQPHTLNFRNDLNQLEQISTPTLGITEASGNSIRYPNIYGLDIDLIYEYNADSLKEKLVLENFNSIPIPQDYIINGGNPTIDLDFLVTWKDDLKIFINEIEWDGQTTGNINGEIEFRLDGETIFKLKQVEAYDSKGDTIEGYYKLRKSGNKIYVVAKIPYNWLVTANYPITIDPTVVTSSSVPWDGEQLFGFRDQVFYDHYNERFHITYVANDNDIESWSADINNLTNWTQSLAPVNEDTYDLDDYDCIVEDNGTINTLHCTFSDGDANTLYYNQCQLTDGGVNEYMHCPAKQTTIVQADGLDDIGYPVMELNELGCAVLVYPLEDDSIATTNDEWQLSVVKEISPCSDGIFSTSDHETSYPQEGLQADLGYALPFGAGVVRTGPAGEMFIAHIDTDIVSTFILNGMWFNASNGSDTNGTTYILDSDIEASHLSFNPFDLLKINETHVIVFALDDGSKDLDAYHVIGYDQGLNTQVDTNFNAEVSSGHSKSFDTIYDSDNDVIWIFGSSNGNGTDIRFVNSTDGGFTWSVENTFIDDEVTDVEAFSMVFENKTCQILMRFMDGNNVTIANYTTSSCSNPSGIPTIEFVSPSPVDSSIQNESSLYINITSNDPNTNHTVLVNFNDNLVGWWRLNNESGENSTHFADFINFNNGTCSGSTCPTINSSGMFGNSYRFDGSGDIINFGDILDMGTKDFSVSFWMKPDSNLTTAASGARLIQKRGTGSFGTAPGWYIRFYRSGTDVLTTSGGIVIEDVNIEAFGATNVNVGSTGNFINIVVTFDRDGNGTLYSDTVNVDDFDISFANGSIDNNRDLTFGGSDVNPTQFYSGLLDDVQIYDRVLSQEEINSIYNSQLYQYENNFTNLDDGDYTVIAYVQDLDGNINSTESRTVTIKNPPTIEFVSPTPANNSIQSESNIYVNVSSVDNNENHSVIVDFNNTLVGWYRFNNESGENTTHFTDWSTYNNNATCTNCPTVSTLGKYGGSLLFNDDRVVIADDPNVALTSGNYSWTGWFNTTSTTAFQTIIGDGSSVNDVLTYVHNSGGIALKHIQDSTLCTATSHGDVSTNTWYHFGISVESYVVSMYMNGVLIDTGCTAADIPTGGDPVWIGERNNAGGDIPFFGHIDDIAIYNRAITAEEVNASYNAQLYQYEKNFTELADGDYTVIAYAQDLAGNLNNSGSRTITIGADPTAPTDIVITSPLNASFTSVPNGFVSILASFTETNPDSCTFQVSNTTTVNVNYTNSSPTSNECSIKLVFADGNVNATVFVNDTSSNINSSQGFYNFTVDTTKPIGIDFLNPTPLNLTLDPSSTPIVNVTFADTNFQNCTMNWYNETGSPGGINFTNTTNNAGTCLFNDFGIQAEGQVNVTVFVFDAAGNVNQTLNRRWTIQFIPPPLNVTDVYTWLWNTSFIRFDNENLSFRFHINNLCIFKINESGGFDTCE